MKHIKNVTVAKASNDPLGFAFLQIWLVVFTSIITGAFGGKR